MLSCAYFARAFVVLCSTYTACSFGVARHLHRELLCGVGPALRMCLHGTCIACALCYTVPMPFAGTGGCAFRCQLAAALALVTGADSGRSTVRAPVSCGAQAAAWVGCCALFVGALCAANCARWRLCGLVAGEVPFTGVLCRVVQFLQRFVPFFLDII